MPRNGEHGVAGDPGQHRVRQRRRVNHAIAYHEEILARPFRQVAEDIERDPFRVPVAVGLHADELGIQVIAAGLSQ